MAMLGLQPFPKVTMSDGPSVVSIPSLSKFETDSSYESTIWKDVSSSGSLIDLSLETPVFHNSPLQSLEAFSELDLSEGPRFTASSILSMDC